MIFSIIKGLLATLTAGGATVIAHHYLLAVADSLGKGKKDGLKESTPVEKMQAIPSPEDSATSAKKGGK